MRERVKLIDVSKGTFIIVEPSTESELSIESDFQVVIMRDGQRHIYPEGMDLEFIEAVQLADELRKQMELPSENAWVTSKAMITNGGQFPVH